jgi:hypothetical protein
LNNALEGTAASKRSALAVPSSLSLVDRHSTRALGC